MDTAITEVRTMEYGYSIPLFYIYTLWSQTLIWSLFSPSNSGADG